MMLPGRVRESIPYEQISWEGTQIIPPFLNVLIAAKSIWMDLSNSNVKIWRVKGL